MTPRKFARKAYEIEVVPVRGLRDAVQMGEAPDWVQAYVLADIILFTEDQTGAVLRSTLGGELTHHYLSLDDFFAYSEDTGVMALSQEHLDKYYYEFI